MLELNTLGKIFLSIVSASEGIFLIMFATFVNEYKVVYILSTQTDNIYDICLIDWYVCLLYLKESVMIR